MALPCLCSPQSAHGHKAGTVTEVTWLSGGGCGFFLVCGGGGAGLGEAERCLRQSCSALETAFALGMGDMD